MRARVVAVGAIACVAFACGCAAILGLDAGEPFPADGGLDGGGDSILASDTRHSDSDAGADAHETGSETDPDTDVDTGTDETDIDTAIDDTGTVDDTGTLDDTGTVGDTAPPTFTLTVDDPDGGCSVTVDAGTASSAITQTFPFASGDVVNLAATPTDSTFVFLYWLNTAGNTSTSHDTAASTTVTVTADTKVQACCPPATDPTAPCPAIP